MIIDRGHIDCAGLAKSLGLANIDGKGAKNAKPARLLDNFFPRGTSHDLLRLNKQVPGMVVK